MANGHRHVAEELPQHQHDQHERPHESVAAPQIDVPVATARALAGVVAGVVLLALLGLLLLWPDRAAAGATVSTAYRGVTYHTGLVTALREHPCAATSEDRLPDGTIPAKATCATSTIALGGKTVQVNVPLQVSRGGLGAGDRVRLVLYPAQDGSPATYAWSDYDRTRPLLILAALFVAVILAVARWRGLATVAGLVVAFPLLILFVLPALRTGENAVLVSLVSAVLMLTVLLFIAHGPSVRTTVAWLGAVGGVLITTGLALAVTVGAHMNGLSSHDDYVLGQFTSGEGLTGVVLCGMVLAGIGLLNDVTIAQVSAVWELRAVAPDLGPRRLFFRGLKIGSDNMSSSFYTLIFAYVGAALPALLLLDLYRQPLSEVLVDGQVAEQLARIMVGGIGLVLAIPLTTLAAALIATAARPVHPAGVHTGELER